jgi:hypothetical protein
MLTSPLLAYRVSGVIGRLDESMVALCVTGDAQAGRRFTAVYV